MIKRSISVRLALMFALASVLIISAVGIVLRSSLHDSLQKQMHNELRFRESLMAPWILSRTSLDGWQTLSSKFTDLATAEGGRVQYWLLSDNPQLQIGGPPPVGVQWGSLKSGFSKVPGATEGSCSLFIFVAEIPAEGERPALRYVVAIDSTPYMGTLNEFTRTLVIIAFIGVFLIALLGFVIARIGMRPVNKLSEQAHHLAPGDHGQRLDTATLPDELQKLAIAFNGVLERQAIAWQQLESFNADVAHELRTPLTNLMGQTQLGLSRTREISELEDLLASNLEELERMTSIVNDMLFLSHAQAGDHAIQLTEVSLREESYKTTEYVEPSFADEFLGRLYDVLKQAGKGNITVEYAEARLERSDLEQLAQLMMTDYHGVAEPYEEYIRPMRKIYLQNEYKFHTQRAAELMESDPQKAKEEQLTCIRLSEEIRLIGG